MCQSTTFPLKNIQKAVAKVFDDHSDIHGLNQPSLVSMVLSNLECNASQFASVSNQITTYIRGSSKYVIVSGVGGGVFQKKHAREALKGEARAIQSRMDTLVEEMESLSSRAKTVKRGFAKLEK